MLGHVIPIRDRTGFGEPSLGNRPAMGDSYLDREVESSLVDARLTAGDDLLNQAAALLAMSSLKALVASLQIAGGVIRSASFR